MAGIMEPTTGIVETLGMPIATMSSNRRAKMRLHSIGFIFQQFNLVPTLTVIENVAMPMLIAGRSRREAMAAAASQLDHVGLGEFKTGSPSRLSGGQQQRVAIARALVMNPKLIVCDEPTSALDAATGHRVMKTLRDTAMRSDRLVVIVTHDPRIYSFADRIVTMEDGRILSNEPQTSSPSPA
jgi:putative ABC transport system ATP-binding protein